MKTRYDFEIQNDLGSVQGSVTLVVEEDTPSTQHSKAADVVEKTDGFESNHIGKEKFGECDTVAIDVVKKTNSPESNPITVEEYKEYVADLHSLNNKGFETQYKVYRIILYVIVMASSSPNSLHV